MNSAIELHDSWVVSLTSASRSITVRLGPAYVHQSDGRPGVDSGSVWTQDIDLIVSEYEMECDLAELPQQLDDGSLQLDGRGFRNVVPLPLHVRGAVRFSARSMSGEELVIRGNGATLVPLGEARFVEAFAAGPPEV